MASVTPTAPRPEACNFSDCSADENECSSDSNHSDNNNSSSSTIDTVTSLWALVTLGGGGVGEEPAAVVGDPALVTRAVARALLEACRENERRTGCRAAELLKGEFGCARGRTPTVDVARYVERLARYTRATPDELVLALALVDRALAVGQRAGSGLALTRRTSHRLFAAALVVALKFEEDVCRSNAYYAQVAGVPTDELNALEAALLARLGFCAWVAVETLAEYARPVLALAAAIGASEALDEQQQQQQATLAAPEELLQRGRPGHDTQEASATAMTTPGPSAVLSSSSASATPMAGRTPIGGGRSLTPGLSPSSVAF
eukprot:m51a1_g4201 hypothetical protein (319) ;mRNA; r:10422-11378